MHGARFYTALLDDLYGLGPTNLTLLHESTATSSKLFHVKSEAGEAFLLRAYPNDVAPPWWLPQKRASEWVAKQARLLAWLNDHSYPTPRLVMSSDGGQFVVKDGWSCLLTSYVEGEAVTLIPATAFRLGELLGELHALDAASPALRHLASWWHLPYAAEAALGRLAALESLLPTSLQVAAEAFSRALSGYGALASLPQTLIHADLWPGNALQSEAGMVLIDWENAGYGVALLDLAAFLRDCTFFKSRSAPSLTPSERVGAIIRGYSQQRPLTGLELAALPQAMRFTAAHMGTIRFEQAVNAADEREAQQRRQLVQSFFQGSESCVRLVERYLSARD